MVNTPPTEQKEADIAAPPHENKPTFISAGTRIHHWGTYLGVDWIFNAISGVTYDHLAKETNLGRKIWSEPIKKGFEAVLEGFIKDPTKRASSVTNGVTFINIIAGGMMTIPPLLALENKKNRKAITRALDETIYGKDQVANDPKFEQSYQAIDREPKKDFGAGMIARFAALAPLLFLIINSKTAPEMDKHYFNHIAEKTKLGANAIGITEEKLFGKKGAEESKRLWKAIHRTLSVDLGLGIPYAILHSFFYNKFSKIESAQHHQHIPIPTSAPPSLTTQSTRPQTPMAGTPNTQIQQAHHIPPQQADHNISSSMNR